MIKGNPHLVQSTWNYYQYLVANQTTVAIWFVIISVKIVYVNQIVIDISKKKFEVFEICKTTEKYSLSPAYSFHV